MRPVYDYYLNGHEGCSLGMKEIAKRLNDGGVTMRGRAFGMQKIFKILSSPVYAGEWQYNVIDSKNAKKRPPAEWIAITVEPIIDAETLQRVRQRRERRRRSAVPPRLLSSRVLLTGLLKCGHCGGSLTMATGKSGRYRYYKCTSRMNKGNRFCESRNVPMDRLDELVVSTLETRVLTTTKLQKILSVARTQLQQRGTADRQKLSHLQAELRKAEGRLSGLYEAVETGVLPLDGTLQQRMHRVKADRESLLIEMAGLRRLQTLPLERILPSQVEAFGKVMRRRLRDRSSTFARDYLRAVVDRIVVTGNEA